MRITGSCVQRHHRGSEHITRTGSGPCTRPFLQLRRCPRASSAPRCCSLTWHVSGRWNSSVTHYRQGTRLRSHCTKQLRDRRRLTGVAAQTSAVDHGRPAGTAAVTPDAAPPNSTQMWPEVPQQYQHKTYLQELRVQDFALISQARIEFKPGLNGISGQSGSGKSVLLAALMQLVGAVADADSVRHPADTAVIEGRWWLEPHMCHQVTDAMRSMSLPDKALPGGVAAAAEGGSAGGYLHIKREISTCDGGSARSRVWINGIYSSLRVLRALGALLVDVNAQHASVALRSPQQQLQLLDKVAGTSPLVEQLSQLIGKLTDLEDQLADAGALADEEERKAVEKDLDMIDRAKIEPGEEQTLRRRLSALQSRQNCLETAAIAQASIQDDMGGSESLLAATRQLTSRIRGILAAEQQQQRLLQAELQQRHEADSTEGGQQDAEQTPEEMEDLELAASTAAISKLAAAVEELEVCAECCAEASAQLKQYANLARYSQSEASAASERLQQLTQLCRRFRVRDTNELLDKADEWSDQLEAYYDSLDRQEQWQVDAATLQQQITDVALQLSSARQQAAAALSLTVEGCLGQLAMSSSRFLVNMRWQRSDEDEPCSVAVSVPRSADPAASRQQGSSDSEGVLYKLGPTGLDTVEFLLSAGPSEPPRPLSAVASGGEAARVMLALKAAPAAAAVAGAAVPQQLVEEDLQQQNGTHHGLQQLVPEDTPSRAIKGFRIGPPVVLLDETDAGVGARLGETVGRLLQSMTGGDHPAAQQLIVVSHTPQVAACASHHVQVAKAITPEDQRVVTTFNVLSSYEDRQAELAEMMGRPGDPQALKFAADMLAKAHSNGDKTDLAAVAAGIKTAVGTDRLYCACG